MVILAALSVLVATTGGVATMETQLAGNFKRSVSGGLSADYAAWETARAFQDFRGGTLVGAGVTVDAAWSAVHQPTGAAFAYGGADVLGVEVRAAREYDLKRYGLGYIDSPYLHHANGAPDWGRITAAAPGRLIYFGYGNAADPAQRGYYTTDAATMNPPVLFATVPNRFGAAYGTREYLLLRASGPPILAAVAVSASASVTNDGALYASDDTTCGTMLAPAPISEGALAAGFVAALYAHYQTQAAACDGDAAVATGVYRLSDADVHADGSGILLLPHAGTRLQNGVTWRGVVLSLADRLSLSPWARVEGVVLAEGDVTIEPNASVRFQSCAVLEALDALPAYRMTLN